MIGRNDACWCGSGKKWKKCHFPQTDTSQAPPSSAKPPSLQSLAKQYLKDWGIMIKTPEQIEGIRKACHLTAQILDEVCLLVQPGVTTEELNRYAHEKVRAAGGVPASLHYGSPPFPKSICTSVNEVICHGIPNDTPLVRGDIVNVDIAVILDGYYGDCSKMVAVGGVASQERKLVFDVALQGLQESIQRAVKPGLPLSGIGSVIHDIADRNGVSVVTAFVGHGVGLKYHESPQVVHSRNGFDLPLVPGMIFTIEPMINAGVKEHVIDTTDKWTARTKDGKASAQWEHTVLVTEDGAEILTPWTVTTCELE